MEDARPKAARPYYMEDKMEAIIVVLKLEAAWKGAIGQVW